MKGEDIDAGFETRAVSRVQHWRLTRQQEDEAPGLDEYLGFRLSGVQPVRDEAVLDVDRARLTQRMEDYFDPALAFDDLKARHPGFAVERARYNPPEVRAKLLREKSGFSGDRIVRFMFRPLDWRWLYWETRHKLLNEARVQLEPVHQIKGQRYIVQPETPRRRFGARPAITSAVPGFECVDPNGRAFPRLDGAEVGVEQLSLEPTGLTEPHTTVNAEWLEAARLAGVSGTDIEVGDVVFYALIALLYSPMWGEAVPREGGTFPGVPLPGSADLLHEAAELGRQIALLSDPWEEVVGVTTGSIRPALRDLAVPNGPTPRVLTEGRLGHRGGQWEATGGGLVRWSSTGGWLRVPEELWTFTIGGFEVLPKWLSYRHGRTLSPDEIDGFSMLCRRIAAIIELLPNCDALLGAAKLKPLTPLAPGAALGPEGPTPASSASEI